MISRKAFILTAIISAVSLTLLGRAMGRRVKNLRRIIKSKPEKALVFWYSQTGNTARIGKHIAAAWRNAGLHVDSGDYRDIDKNSLNKYDLIAAGTPVYYYQVPENLRKWIETVPFINNIPVISFATYGGEGGNQHNTSCELLDLLVQKGGIPVDAATFGCMSSYALTWSYGNSARVLRYKDKPDSSTYRDVADFADTSLIKISNGNISEISGNFSLRNIIKGAPSIALTKLLITGHGINKEKCISCGRCRRACTVDAINPDAGTVNTEKCIACLGCINNCPTGAVVMKFSGKDVYGYPEFIKKNNIRTVDIHESGT